MIYDHENIVYTNSPLQRFPDHVIKDSNKLMTNPVDLLSLANKSSRADVTEGLNLSLLTKSCTYFHYCYDGFDDRVSI